MKRFVIMAMVAALAATPLLAQSDDGGIETDEDALFGTPATSDTHDPFAGSGFNPDGAASEDDLFGGSLVEELAPDTDNFVDEVLAGGTTIGGRYSLSTGIDWSWQNFGAWDDAAVYDGVLMSADLAATLFLDARPSEDLRVFLKGEVEYPFSYEADTIDFTNEEVDSDGRQFDDVFHVTELFSDFDYKDMIFFRGGKQTINWGVGYYFSPADLLNVTEINPEDPEAELEGPLALKAHLPIGINNLYLYVVPGGDQPENTTFAPKAEAVVAGWEIGVGGLYRFDEDLAPSLMATVSGSWRDFQFFGEGVARYGSDKTFVVEDSLAPFGVAADPRDDEWFLSATAGFLYSYSDDDGYFNLNLIGQYFYNGEGYTEEFLDDNATGIGVLLANEEINALDIAYQPGQHYAAATGSWSGIFDSDFSASATWIANLSDMSHLVSPSLTWTIDDAISVTSSARLSIGETGDEYSFGGDYASYGISVRLGGGSF